MDEVTLNNNSETNNSSAVSFINPEEVISQMDLQLGSQVADFGCGTGYFSFPLAKKLKAEGTVYALDVLKEKLETIESQAKLSGLTNIITRRVNLEKEGGSKFDDGSLDWVVIKDMLYQNSNKKTILLEAKRVIKNEGRILIVEWDLKDFSVGPKKELRISKENLEELVSDAGLVVTQEITAGDFHYGLILSK